MSIVLEGATASLRTNGAGHHWEGLHFPNLTESLGKAMKSQGDDLPPNVKLFMMVGTYMQDQYHGRMYAKAQNLRPRLRAGYDEAFQQFDLLAMPTVPVKAFRHEPDLDVLGIVAHSLSMNGNTAAFNHTGHPAISVPCGKSDGLPVGLMLVGRHFEDATVLRAAHAFEQHVNWETL
jgi:amidase